MVKPIPHVPAPLHPEHYTLSCISPFVATTDNQSGFKQQLGTDMCIFLLKQIVVLCILGYPSVCRFLRCVQTKAFDRTNYTLLFAKLTKRDVPMYIVITVMSWDRHYTGQVK